MDGQLTTKSLEDLGVVNGARPLNDAVAQLSVSSDIIGRGLQSSIERNSSASFTTAPSAEESEVSVTNVTLTPNDFSNEPLFTNRSTTTAAILSTGPSPETDDTPVVARKETPVPPIEAPAYMNSDVSSTHPKLKTPKLILPSKLPSADHSTPAETEATQSPRMRAADVNNEDAPTSGHAHPLPSDSYIPPSGAITSESQGNPSHITIDSTMDSTFDGFVVLPDGTHRPSKTDPTPTQYVHTSTPRPPPPPPRARTGRVEQPHPQVIDLSLNFTQSKILHEPPVTPIPLPPRAAKRKRGNRQLNDSALDQNHSDQVIITQTVSSDSSEDTMVHINTALPQLPANLAHPANQGPSDLTDTKGQNTSSIPRGARIVSTKPQIAESNMLDLSQPSTPASIGELSKLIAALTHIGPIGQTTPPTSSPNLKSKSGLDAGPSSRQDLVDLSTDMSRMEIDPPKFPPLSTKTSAVWPSQSEATASWFGDMVVNRALDNSMITPTQNNPTEDSSKRVKISEKLPSDDNLRIIRDFQNNPRTSPNTRSVSLPQPEEQKESDRQPHSKLDLPYLLEKEWRGVRARLIQGNKTKARAVHLAELCLPDPFTGDPPVLTLWAMGLEPLPDFVMEDDHLQNLVALHRKESALDLQSKIAAALHERADAQLKLAHTTLAQTQTMAESDDVPDFSKALDVLAKLVGRDKAATKNQLRKRRPTLKQRQPTKLDWINFHNFSAAVARSRNKGTLDNARRSDKPESTSRPNPSPLVTNDNNLKDFTIPKSSRGRQKAPTTRKTKDPTPTAGTSNQTQNPSIKPASQPTKAKNANRKRGRSRSRNRDRGGSKDVDNLAPSSQKRQPASQPPVNNRYQPPQMPPFVHQMQNMPFYFPNPFMFGPPNPGFGPPNPIFGQPQQNQRFPRKNHKGKNKNRNNQASNTGRQQ